MFAVATAPLWTAPLFGEDPMVVSWLAEGGVKEGLADFSRPQYGLSSVRFYRPLASLSIAAQAAISTDAAWLRSANLLVFFAGIASACALARRLGAGTLGIAFVGIWLALFPGGPGDWCWVVGRVDAFSFGLGFLGLAVLAAGEAPPGFRRAAGAGALLFAACLTKETGVAFAPAAVALALAIHGRRALVAALVAAGFVGFAIGLRAVALDFAGGGYVGEPASLGRLLGRLTGESAVAAASLSTGLPSGWGLLLVLPPFVLLAAQSRLFLASALLVAAAALAAPSVTGLGPAPEPVQARLFPTFYAVVGIAWGLVLSALPAKPALRALLAIVLVAAPAAALVRSVNSYRDSGRRLEEDFQTIDAARRAHPTAALLLFAGAYQAWPDGGAHAFLYNLGLPERFAVPGPAVWPLRPAVPDAAAHPLPIPRSASWFVARDGLHAGVLPVDASPALLTEGIALPNELTGADAAAMAAGTLDRKVSLPSGPPGASAYAVLFTPVGFGRAAIDPNDLSWKSLLLAPAAGSATPLYQIAGYASDYRARRVFLAFQWEDSAGRLVAETPLIEVALAPDFAEYIRINFADPAFGVDRPRAPR